MTNKIKYIKNIFYAGSTVLLVISIIFLILSVTFHILLDRKFYDVSVQKLLPLLNQDMGFLNVACYATCKNHKDWSNTFENTDTNIFCYCNDGCIQKITLELLLPFLIKDSYFRIKVCSIICPEGKWFTDQFKYYSDQFQCECAN